MSGADGGDAGLASGLVNTSVQVGGALGLAVLATLSASRTGSLVRGGDGPAAALTGGYHLAWAISAGIALVSLALATPWIRSIRMEDGAGSGHDAAPADPSADAAVPLDANPSYAEAA
jgi:hypothetical protein